jgi:Cys-rich repeat protein
MCRTNADCTQADARVCDPTLHQCVQCSTAMDTCGGGQVCDPASHRCVPGCRAEADCSGSGMDAGAASDGGALQGLIHCLVAEHRCVQCLTNDHCPSGTVCTSNACVPGCTASRPCPAGRMCCSGMCYDTQNDPRQCGFCGRSCAGGDNACCAGRCVNTQTDPANCGACGTACAPPHAVGRCAAGACAIASCEAGYENVDGMVDNGCECALGTSGTACSSATNVSMVGTGMMQAVRGVLRMPGTDHWYRISFAMGGAPRVRLATNPGGAVRFDVRADCGAAMPFACPDRMEGSVGLDAWEMADTPEMHNSRMVTFPSAVVVRVHATAPIPGCQEYVLAVSN